MRKVSTFFLLALALVVLDTLATANAKEEDVPLDQAPKAVLDAVKAKFPGAKLTEASKEIKDGKTTYEIALEHKRQEYTVSVTAEGTINEVEREMKIKDLPQAVTAAIKKKYPKAELEEAEEVTASDKTTYEVVIETSAKKDIKVTVDSAGKIIEEEELKEENEEKD